MLTIDVRFLHHTLRSASSNNLSALRGGDSGEWPPSPARLFSALTASGGTGARCWFSDCTELRVLESAGPPVIHAETDTIANLIQPRFVVEDKRKEGSVHNYPARSAVRIQPGTRISLRDATVYYHWPDLEVSTHQLKALQFRAARVGYLGCADSPAHVRVYEHEPESDLPVWRPSNLTGGLVADLPVPYEGFLDQLDESYKQFLAGNPPHRSWIRSEIRRYRPDSQVAEPLPCVFWMRLGQPVSSKDVLAVTLALRDAVLAMFGPGRAPAVLHGHHVTPRQGRFDQARFIALPDVGRRYATGRIVGAAIWLPADTDEDVVATIGMGVTGLKKLYGLRGLSVDVEPFDGQPTPWASNPQRWTQESETWTSAYPVMFERYPNGNPKFRDVAQMCRHAGLPNPISFRFSEAPLLPGSPWLKPNDVYREGKQRGPYAHCELTFAEPVAGPVVIGRARQLGLGLMLPQNTGVA